MHILDEILKQKRKEIEAAKLKMPLAHLIGSKHLMSETRSFISAVSTRGQMNLIAEIKRKSPSKKWGFFTKIDIQKLAGIYAENGAKAVSVLTDNRFFGGALSHINEVRRTIGLPVLRKDFIIDEYQVYESRCFGADAILLIARILSREQIKSFMHLAKRIGMDCLIEVHDEKDLEKAVTSGAKIIGVNNRDLDTLSLDIGRTARLVSKMPKEIIKVSESGIQRHEEILRLRKLGVNAVLIGGAFLEAKDIGNKIKEVMGGEQKR